MAYDYILEWDQNEVWVLTEPLCQNPKEVEQEGTITVAQPGASDHRRFLQGLPRAPTWLLVTEEEGGKM